jgi:hypothetical protein
VAGVIGLGVRRVGEVGGFRALAVNDSVYERAVGRVGVVDELTVDPLQVRETRAVDVFVEDASWDEVGEGAGHVSVYWPVRGGAPSLSAAMLSAG